MTQGFQALLSQFKFVSQRIFICICYCFLFCNAKKKEKRIKQLFILPLEGSSTEEMSPQMIELYQPFVGFQVLKGFSSGAATLIWA